MATPLTYEKYLSSIYYDPKHAGAYAGLDKLYRAVRKEGKFVLGRKKIEDWLTKQEDYAVHRETRAIAKRPRVLSPVVDYQWDIDTAYMAQFKKDNDGFAYFVLAIDILSKYVWTVPLKTTTGEEMVQALTRIFASGRQPQHIRTDGGSEYQNTKVKAFLKKKSIGLFVTRNTVKTNFSERAIKTIKGRLMRYLTHQQSRRWIEVLPEITQSYNNTYHRSIKRTPKSVKPSHSVELWKLQYDHVPTPARQRRSPPIDGNYKFNIGDLVRVSFLRRAFQREYDERFSRELFVITERFMRDGIPQYRLKDYAGEIVSGTFYQNQIRKAYEQAVYLVDKVLKRRKKAGQTQVLVHWRGWPSKYDSWVNKDDVRHLNKS